MTLVNDVADMFERCAVDETHTPALCTSLPTCCLTRPNSNLADASFLRALIENKRTGGRTAPGSRAGTRPSSPQPGVEAYLKSRVNSPGLGEGMEGMEAGDHGFDSLAMDTMLSNGDFWNNVSGAFRLER